jgi:Tol biopolymer transport system component
MTRPARNVGRAWMAFAAAAWLSLGFAALPASGAPGDTRLLITDTSGEAVEGTVRSVSPDGRFMLLGTSSTEVVPGGNPPGYLVLDRSLNTSTWVSSFGSVVKLSADGRQVALATFEPLLARDVNGTSDIYLRDVQTRSLTLVSVGLAGASSNDYCDGPAIDGDGRYVAFYSAATNLVAGDTNGTYDVFVRDVQSGMTERVSVSSDGTQGNAISWDPQISADGRYVAFWSMASNLVPGDSRQYSDVFVHDRVTRVTDRVSVSTAGIEANGESYLGRISPDGRFVTFSSAATNLASNDTNAGTWDSFVHDRTLGITERVSVSSEDVQGSAISMPGDVSVDGRYVAFISRAPDLVPGDLNGRDDVFVRDRVLRTTTRVNVSSLGVQSDGGTWPDEPPYITADGARVFFNDSGTNLVPETGALPALPRAYVREVGTTAGADTPFVVDLKLAFGDATIHYDTKRSVVFTNTGSSAISISGIGIAGPNAPAFKATHRCGTAVAAGGACAIDVVLHPYAVGAKSATLNVSAGTSTQTVQLSGRGVTARFVLSATALDFGTQMIGTRSAQQKITIRNSGTTAFPIRWVGTAGNDAHEFDRLRWCPGVLEPGRVCNVPVWFAPHTAGAKSARLVVSPGKTGARKSVLLSGVASGR